MAVHTFQFREVIDLVNFSRTVAIDPAPAIEREAWSLYRGVYRVHIKEVPFQILYIGSDASATAIDEASRLVLKEDTQVVYAASLDQQSSRPHRKLLTAAHGRIWSVAQYLRTFVRAELDAYLAKLVAGAPTDFIEPQVETPAGTAARVPNPLLSYLRPSDTRGMAVMLGEPGQGKTYMSRHLVAQLVQQQKVPIYISSSQWHTMVSEDLRSLPKTITHSFRFFEAPIAWIEGQEERFIRTALRAGLFQIIFDGFDEYILRNDGDVSVADTLEQLSDLQQSTGSPLLLTSRSTFWDANVDTKSFQADGSSIYRIEPFDQQQARNYFERRFGEGHGDVGRAVGLYSSLAAAEPEFVGRGFVLKLVADLAEGGGPQTKPNSKKPIHWLMEAFCDRETLRQGLPIDGEAQLGVLEQFAAEEVMGADPTHQLLDYCMELCVPSLDPVKRREAVERRMTAHPLLQYNQVDSKWHWTQEQVRFALLALWVIRQCARERGESLHQFIGAQKLTSSEMADLAAMVVELAGSVGEPVDVIGKVVARLTELRERATRVNSPDSDRGLILAIVLRAVERYAPRGSSHQERTALLLRLFGGSPLQEVTFAGTLTRLDIRGVTFTRCRFERVMWANVKADDTTVFDDCRFSGGHFEYCKGLGLSIIRGGHFDTDAEEMWKAAQTVDGRRNYEESDLKADLKILLSKFIAGGGMSPFKTIEADNLKRGPIRRSQHADVIVQDFAARLLEHHDISGVTGGGYHVRPEAEESLRFYAANGVMSGQVKELFDRLSARLLKRK